MADNKPQKREFVRQEVVLPVKYRKYTGNSVFTDLFSVGRTLNLSSGGLMLSVGTPLKTGDKLDLEVELTDRVRVYLVGRVLGGLDQQEDGVEHRIEKVEFVDVDSETQDLIMKFIFESQRRNLRKGRKKP
jgi:c-di-GMP-binding flagellar brake protein YcgR